MTSVSKKNIILTGSVDNNKFKLFEIKEISNSDDKEFSDYILLMPRSKYTILEDGKVMNNLKDYHITIHECPGKESVMIKSTQKDIEGKEISLVQVNPGIKRDHLFIPLLYSIIGDDIVKKYTKSEIKDEVLVGKDYNYKIQQLHYFVALSENKEVQKFTCGTKSIVVPLRKYNLHILYLYMNIITQWSVFRFYQTKSEEYNNLSGKTSDEIENCFINLLTNTRNIIINR
jgi:hypothetical protein